MFIDIFRTEQLPLQVMERGEHQIFLLVESWDLG
jgi:hypothetical protein